MSYRFATIIIIESYAEVGSALVSAHPITIAAWIRPTSVNTVTEIVSIARADTTEYHSLRKNNATIQAITRTNNSRTASATGTAQVGVWNHACAVFYPAGSPSARAAFFNGGGKGTQGTFATPSPLAVTSIARIGGSAAQNYFKGDIAEVGIWNVALTDTEVQMLGSYGVRPLFVRPGNLVSYVPFLNPSSGANQTGYAIDLMRAGGYTLYNTPALQTHPPKLIYGDVGFSKYTKPSSFQPAWYVVQQQANSAFQGVFVS